MLVSLTIQDFAIVEYASFTPGKGLNILTGETGAGKSLIIDAISALLGHRIGREYVRKDCDKAVIEAVFDGISSVVPSEVIDEFGIEVEEDTLILLREISKDGRSIVRINGRVMPVSVLKSIGSYLVDIHGQHDQQTIFDSSKHLGILDDYSGDAIKPHIAAFSEKLNEYREILNMRKQYESDPEKSRQMQDLLVYQIKEIEDGAFREGEEEELVEKLKVLKQEEKRRFHLSFVQGALSTEDSESPLSALQTAAEHLDALSQIDPAFSENAQLMHSLVMDLEGLHDSLGSEDALGAESYDEVEDRLEKLRSCTVKYGGSVSAMNEFLDSAKNRLEMLREGDTKIKQLNVERSRIEKELIALADKIHEIRVEAGKRLSADIVSEVQFLGLSNATFDVSFTKRPKERFFSKTGYDEVEFLFSANKGEDLKPLSKTASGGEAARIMLAIKTILARADATPVLIFDEVDSGISGEAAKAVSQSMKKLSKFHQVFCVTHMGQIAAAADQHFFISKDQSGERTKTNIAELGDSGRIMEVARLLSGNSADEQSQRLAKSLIEERR
ncbi:MAG: DNA repair protein RecN [Clostridiales bacterium]|nr:DNA repair protein RecN [Clostridiales bacterium]